ncbi:ATP-binding protein [Kovacikia minuta CCNUW1]|uniref:ATP-binding protein n=1 Tax=Kovacikia minuta TaxID=2931930 RepID=UPI001CCE44D0|nr:ATP-binding protein [Kovacikia minuta]UBF27456.1 ATP-binding protein [Kovacikia minuta CCNUW1]
MAEGSTSDRSIGIGGDVSGSIIASGDANTITQIIQIASSEVKTRKFIAASPYKGLKKFEQTDRNRFFGREQFVRQLVNDLNQTNLLLLLGASGSGKSSVVRAGLIPQLAQQWGDLFVNLTFNPDNDPFESLYASLLNRYGQTKTQFVRQGRAGTLVQMVETLKSTDAYWLIFVDQFEELFTTSQVEKCNQFIAGLVQLNRWLLKRFRLQDCRVKVVASMRSDFLDRLNPYPDLIKATDQSRPIIADLQLDELRLAIEEPAAQHGMVFEDGLVEEIIKSVQGQAGDLPLLQYTLKLLWETEVGMSSIHDRTLNNRTLNISTYRKLGGVRGALQKHVDQIYGALSKEEQLAAQRIFLKLVGGESAKSEIDWKPLRKRALGSAFSNGLEPQVLKQLIDANLLVSDRPSQANESTVEVAHEILLTAWEKLKGWIQDYREDINLRNRINEDLTHWQKEKKEGDLLPDSRLAQALDLRKNVTFQQVLGGFSEDANQFIDVSKGKRDRQKRNQTIIRWGAVSVAVTFLLGIIYIQQWQRQQEIQSIEMFFLNTNEINIDTLFKIKNLAEIRRRNEDKPPIQI